MTVYVVTLGEFVVGVYSTKQLAIRHTGGYNKPYRVWKRKLSQDSIVSTL